MRDFCGICLMLHTQYYHYAHTNVNLLGVWHRRLRVISSNKVGNIKNLTKLTLKTFIITILYQLVALKMQKKAIVMLFNAIRLNDKIIWHEHPGPFLTYAPVSCIRCNLKCEYLIGNTGVYLIIFPPSGVIVVWMKLPQSVNFGI